MLSVLWNGHLAWDYSAHFTEASTCQTSMISGQKKKKNHFDFWTGEASMENSGGGKRKAYDSSTEGKWIKEVTSSCHSVLPLSCWICSISKNPITPTTLLCCCLGLKSTRLVGLLPLLKAEVMEGPALGPSQSLICFPDARSESETGRDGRTQKMNCKTSEDFRNYSGSLFF